MSYCRQCDVHEMMTVKLRLLSIWISNLREMHLQRIIERETDEKNSNKQEQLYDK